MPAKPFYFREIPQAIAAVQRLESAWIDRRMVEELLGVSKTVAWRILRRSGGQDGPGNTLVCRKEHLIALLTALQEGGEYRQEARRRDRVAEYLAKLAETGRTRRTKVAEDQRAVELLSSRFDRLPAGVALTPRRLSVDFSSPQEFLERIGAVIFALQNDFEAVRDFIEGGLPEAPEPTVSAPRRHPDS